MTTLAHTGQLDAVTLRAARDLLHEVFDDLEDDDWEHCLGGMHALVVEEGQLVGHAALVQRRLLHRGRVLRAGYVEGVAVRADRRGRGHGAAVMAALERVIRGAYELGALSASEEALTFYAARGWQRWAGTASVITPGGLERTEDEEGSIYVLPVSATLTPGVDLACDWRGGDVW